MYKDPTEFRKRFAAWKDGKKPYEAGLPVYRDGLDDTIDFLKQHEGFRDTTYLDGNGIPTIGYGFTDSSLVKKGRITLAEADKLLRKEILKRESNLQKLKHWNKLSEGSKTALRSYYYNYPAGFKDTTKFIKYWNAGDFESAIKEVDAGINDKKNRGLRARRLLEQAMLRQDPFLTKQVSPLVRQLEEQPSFLPVLIQIPIDKTDYSLQNASMLSSAPQAINAWKGKGSPAYGGYSLRMPSIREYMLTGNVMPRGFKDGKLPGYKNGDEPVKVGEYNVYPSAIGATELNVTTPEVVVTGTDRRPLYLRYDAEHSAYDPEAINMFTDFIPGVGDVSQGILAVDAYNKGNYLSAGILGAGLVLPSALGKMLTPVFRKIAKPIKRIFFTKSSKLYNDDYYRDIFLNLPDQVASKQSDYFRPRTNVEKAKFGLMYAKGLLNNKFLSEDLQNISIKDYMDLGLSRDEAVRLQKLFNRNPEYALYLKTLTKSNTNLDLDPFSLNTVDDFLKTQFTSLRGVHADTEDAAILYLTHVEKGRKMPGGDRLDTNGGIYTSNSTNVADRFKNPEYGTQDGYVGKVVYPYNIRRDIPIEELLELYRKMVFPAGSIHPMYGTDFYFKELNNAKNGGAIALESDYVGRASAGLPGQERAYLPYGEGSHPILTVEDLYYYPGLTNKNGRWGYGMTAGDTKGLFVPRQMNAYSDYVRSAKAFLQPVKERDVGIYDKVFNEVLDNINNQVKRRRELINKLWKNLRRAGVAILAVGFPSAGIGIGIGTSSLLRSLGLMRDLHFYDSPLFDKYLNDRRSDVMGKNYDEKSDEAALDEYYLQFVDSMHHRRDSIRNTRK